jgi:hypothetical protein
MKTVIYEIANIIAALSTIGVIFTACIMMGG